MSPLKYDTENDALEAFQPILQEHSQWFHDLLNRLFYPEENDLSTELRKPTSFAQWVVSSNSSETIRPEIVERLNALHNDLFNKASALCDNAMKTQMKPEYKQYRELITLFEEFVFHVRRLEKDLLAEGSGFDSFIGLRSKNMLLLDVSREMERLSRHGKSFCLALARIDRFKDILKTVEKSEADGYIKLIASLVKISMRSFDDAYYMGDGVYALCLKQTDITGGFTALERLRKELEYQEISVRFSAEEGKPLSMSCCIAEPVIGDEVEELMKYLSNDLATSDMENTDTVLKYRELSALERYVQKN
ncbi:MAG: diguanylate cyclase [Alphaproteobacteria bacterium]|nr:diguanylate cyclase [Alphaproteobacteria bacterium]